YPEMETLFVIKCFRFHHFVDEAVFCCFFGCHEVVAVCVLLDFIERLPCAFRKDLVEFLTCSQDMLGGDFDFCRLTLCTAEWLVDHDFGVRQCETLAFCSGCEQE